MAQFHPLQVTGLRKTIREATVVTLSPMNGGDFSFTQGQYLTFRHLFDGEELRRSYSICAGLDDGSLQVGIKQVDGGTFSTWANTELKVGDVVEAMPPMGKFHTPLDPSAARSYLGFAGGSGITPLLSIIKTTLGREPSSQFTLVYANRAVNTIMFRDELEDLKNRYMGRFTLIHVLEQDAQEIDLFTGRVDATKCAALFKSWIDVTAVDTAFICGPKPMMLTIADALRAHGLRDDQIKYELFASDQPGRAKARAAAAEAAGAKGATAIIALDGGSHTVQVAPGQTILEAALANDMNAPYSCKAGVCSTCICKVVEGKVEMLQNHALEDYEVERGYALSCQSIPLTETVRIVYEDH